MAVEPHGRARVNWASVHAMVGGPMTRTLRLWARSPVMDSWNSKLFTVLVQCAHEIASARSKQEAAEARKRGVRLAQTLVAGRHRELRAEEYARRRASLMAHQRVESLSDELLRLRRQRLPERFTTCSQSNGFQTLREVLDLLAFRPELEAGEFALLLGQKCMRAAHEKPNSVERKALPPTPAREVWGECAICAERRPRAPLVGCSHASSCRRCLHIHTMQRLRSGCAPACPLCRTQFSAGEVCLFLAPHQLLSPKRRNPLEIIERGRAA